MVHALKGEEGWGKQALTFGGPQDIDLAGHKIRKGVALWRVGTWPLKASFYAELEKLGIRSGSDREFSGVCPFASMGRRELRETARFRDALR